MRQQAPVRFGRPAAGAARVAVCDLLGREVAVLADGERSAERHEVPFRASGLAVGVYVARLETGGDARTQRFTVAR